MSSPPRPAPDAPSNPGLAPPPPWSTRRRGGFSSSHRGARNEPASIRSLPEGCEQAALSSAAREASTRAARPSVWPPRQTTCSASIVRAAATWPLLPLVRRGGRGARPCDRASPRKPSTRAPSTKNLRSPHPRASSGASSRVRATWFPSGRLAQPAPPAPPQPQRGASQGRQVQDIDRAADDHALPLARLHRHGGVGGLVHAR